MVKIKREVKKNLPQLIEWGFNNPKEVESKVFESDNIDYFWNTANVQFSNDGCGVRMSSSVSVDDTFTIEVEEEITEDNAFNMLVALYKYPRLQKIFSYRDNTSIRQFKDLEDDIVSAIYMVNDDSTMTLIWRDGKLVK